MAVGTLKYLHNLNPKGQWKQLLILCGIGAAGVVFLMVVLLTYLGVIAPWSGRLVYFNEITNKEGRLYQGMHRTVVFARAAEA